MSLYTLADSVRETEKLFKTFVDGEEPDLVPTGISAIDKVIGGLGPGTLMLIGAGPGVGKSSVVLESLMNLQRLGIKGGYQSNEDGPDMIGSRVLARYSGVNSLKIRKKSFNEHEFNMLKAGRVKLAGDAQQEHAFLTSYAVSGSLASTVQGIRDLGEAGCKIIFMDYLQKIHGGSGERRYDIGQSLSALHQAAVEFDASLILLSQVSRQPDPTRMPSRFALKESGDIENEARVILMLAKAKENDGVVGNLDKSSFGGEGTKCSWGRRSDGTLEEMEFVDGEDF